VAQTKGFTIFLDHKVKEKVGRHIGILINLDERINHLAIIPFGKIDNIYCTQYCKSIVSFLSHVSFIWQILKVFKNTTRYKASTE
jgi:hypothetical protein